MQKKGLIFLDVIIGLFIIGLIVVSIFPVLASIQKNFIYYKKISQMTYLSETTIERLSLKDELSLKFLNQLELDRELEYPYSEDETYLTNIKLLNDNPYLWELTVVVMEAEGGQSNVELTTTIRK